MLVGGSKLITKNSISCNSLLNTTLESSNQNVKQFWQIDSYGSIPESQLISPSEKRDLELLEKKRNLSTDISKLVYYGKTIFPYFKTTSNLLSNTSNLLKIGFQKTQNSLTCTRVRLTITYHQNKPNCYHLKRKTTQVPSLII